MTELIVEILPPFALQSSSLSPIICLSHRVIFLFILKLLWLIHNTWSMTSSPPHHIVPLNNLISPENFTAYMEMTQKTHLFSPDILLDLSAAIFNVPKAATLYNMRPSCWGDPPNHKIICISTS